MRYGSVCSGIEAASVAWHPLGWSPQFFAEIEAFPSAVLKHHYPTVPNHGDMTKFKDWPDHAIDLLVGGTPCQSFSVAGLRAGLADPRGNLALTYLAIAAKYRPRWLVWENVPGVLSADGGEAFGSILGGMVELGYGVAYRVLDAQFCRTLGFAGAVPQRRRRVFVVGYLGDWRRAAAVLFDGASLRGDHPPSRRAGQNAAPTLSARPTGGGGLGSDFEIDGGLIPGVSKTLAAARGAAAANAEDLETYLPVAHSLRAEGFDATEDGTGRGTPLTPEISPALKARDFKGPSSDGDGDGAPLLAVPQVAASLTRGAESAGNGGYAGRRQEDDSNIIAFNARQDPIPGSGVTAPIDTDGTTQAIAFDTTQITSAANRSNPQSGDPSHPIPAHGHAPAVAFDMRGREGGAQFEGPHDTANIRAASGGSSRSYVASWAVRRLTPVECCRLQGFPDDYLSQVTYRGKAPADGPIYKALGNSMAVNSMRVLGQRIQMVDEL